jgi:transcriptional regulator with XRE-family HTH domain
LSNRAISTELIELGERIRKRRQEMKLSQESFAEKAGISVNTVSRIEGGQTAMSVEIFRKMIEILETDANILLGKEEGDTERQESVQEVLYQIQKLEWKEQKIIMQTIDSLIDSFNEYR